jgi:patatin-like phospholipase/acyl hydrolase
MRQINESIKDLRRSGSLRPDVRPQDIFELVAGTSTGGLIAIMLGKLGMSVEQCIDSYQELSRQVFGRKHFRGRLTGGLAPSKYSGRRLQKCVQRLLRDRGFTEDLSMAWEDNTDKIAW